MRSVAFLTRVLTHYRVPFHQIVRQRLAREGVHYRLLYGRPSETEAEKNDLGSIDWAEPVRCTYLGGGRLSWLDITGLGETDLVIIGQENSLLNNYALIAERLVGRRVAFFGHGKNFQSANPNGRAERFKRFWITRVDWWFAYTELSADIVARAGFPRERITVFNNAIDTSAIRNQIAGLEPAEVEALRRERFSGSANIGVYIGGLYDHKRVPFLIEAARAVRALVPDFQLVVVGGGVDAHLVQAAAANEPWIHALGPMFGREKTLVASLGKVFLMPGLVGLGVLDSFAYGMPMVTCDLPFHSPEIDYLKDGVNGVIVKDADSVADYAAAVARILNDAPYRAKLTTGAAEAIGGYTIETMAERFADGVLRALASPPNRGRRAALATAPQTAA